MNHKKQLYRAIKYVWNPEWIGEDAFKNEILAAQRACVAEIIMDYSQDLDTELDEAQLKLTTLHIQKYGQCKVEKHIDRCYSKVSMEVMI